MKSKILKVSKSCGIFVLKILRWMELCLKICEISAGACAKFDRNRFDYWALSYVYFESRWYRWRIYHVPRWVWRILNTDRTQSQPVSKLNEICVFVYPILVIPRWGRQTIHNIILLTGIGAKMSHVACHTIRPHFSHCCEKKRKVKKLIIFNRW